MEKKGRIYGIGIGPGRCEWMTIQAMSKINNSDYIYCPGTINKSGEVKSKARDILSDAGVDMSKIKLINVPMSKNRDKANQVYEEVSNEIISLYEKCKKISIITEGDSSFYASIGYMVDKIRNKGYQIESVSGIPAFIAACSIDNIQLVRNDDRLLVIPGDVKKDELIYAKTNKYTVVIMKPTLGEDNIKEFLEENIDKLDVRYFENVGTSTEVYISDIKQIIDRKFIYFSIVIIKISDIGQ